MHVRLPYRNVHHHLHLIKEPYLAYSFSKDAVKSRIIYLNRVISCVFLDLSMRWLWTGAERRTSSGCFRQTVAHLVL